MRRCKLLSPAMWSPAYTTELYTALGEASTTLATRPTDTRPQSLPWDRPFGRATAPTGREGKEQAQRPQPRASRHRSYEASNRVDTRLQGALPAGLRSGKVPGLARGMGGEFLVARVSRRVGGDGIPASAPTRSWLVQHRAATHRPGTGGRPR